MKTCKRCQQKKSLTDFGKDKNRKDGFTDWCKPCRNEYRLQWRENNLEHAKEIERKNKRDERERKGKEHFREYDRQWYAKNADKKKEYVAERRKKDKKKIRAQNKLNKAIQSGKIKRPSKCDHCGKRRKVDGHHHDYNKPYDVVWLCRSCHMTEHSNYLEL